MRKASNGHGSIRKVIKNGRPYFEARYTDPITHQQKSVNATTEAECSRKLLEQLARITTGSYVTPSRVTLGSWIGEWLARKTETLQPGTAAKYESACRLYIVPRLGRVKLTELRRAACQDFIDGLKDLAPKTVHNIAGVLSAACADAAKREIIAKNPAEGLDLPRIEKKAPVALDSEAQKVFEAAVQNSPYRNVFLVCLHTGARISEVLGLRWRDIDMKTGEMRITGQLERKQGNIERARKDTTKSHRDRVTVVPPYVIAFLKDEKRRQAAHQLHAGQDWQNDEGLVFTRDDGSPIPHRTIEHSFDRLKARIGHPEITLHTLRKAFITNMIHAGEDVKNVAAQVGHSTSAITLQVYTAERREDMEKAAERRQKEYESAPR